MGNERDRNAPQALWISFENPRPWIPTENTQRIVRVEESPWITRQKEIVRDYQREIECFWYAQISQTLHRLL